MFYIHQSTCISAQQTFLNADINYLNESAGNKLYVVEPSYDEIPVNILRRMGKAVRIGVGASLPLLKQLTPDGIIIGTANGGMEDCIKFLNQIIHYEEGMLTPGNFVQSTPNVIASQVSLLTGNKGYNITHVHRGLAFEYAAIDAAMLIREHPLNTYLLGGVDEISGYNYHIDLLAGWYRKEIISNSRLYSGLAEGAMAGEGAAMFVVNGRKESAVAALQDVMTVHTTDSGELASCLQEFIRRNLAEGEHIDLFLSGENGDCRSLHFGNTCESLLEQGTAVARFKHMTGEFETASAIALWLCCHILQTRQLPLQMIKIAPAPDQYKKILLYNQFKNRQHSFMMVGRPTGNSERDF